MEDPTISQIAEAVDKIEGAVIETKVAVAAAVDVAKTSEILALGKTYEEIRASEIAETLVQVTAILDQAAAATWSLNEAKDLLVALIAKLSPRDARDEDR